MRKVLRLGLLPIGIVVAWTLYTSSRPSLYFPPPSAIFAALIAWYPLGVTEDLLPSVLNVILALAIVIVLGVIIGTLIGLDERAYMAVWPMIDFVRAVPKPALIPVVVVLMGIESQSRIFIIVLGSVWPVLIAAIDGVHSMEPAYFDVARVFHISRVRRYFGIVLPGAAPSIMSGLRTAVGIALVMMVISEMVAATHGVGHFIVESQRRFDMAAMWAGIVVVGLLGLVFALIVMLIERVVLRWQH